MSTFATLLVVPSVFALVIGRKGARSPSIYPDDKQSKYYDPHVFDGNGEGESAGHDTSSRGDGNGQTGDRSTAGSPERERGRAAVQDEKSLLTFPWEPFYPSTRDPYETHHNLDELRGTLGFDAPEAGARQQGLGFGGDLLAVLQAACGVIGGRQIGCLPAGGIAEA